MGLGLRARHGVLQRRRQHGGLALLLHVGVPTDLEVEAMALELAVLLAEGAGLAEAVHTAVVASALLQ
jgi:hypothetical protein